MANPQGIDVSHYQGDVDWQAVRAAGMEFAFAKATQGTGYVDPRFSRNWQAMKAAGLRRGAYHFFEAGDDPTAQADHFVATVGTLGPDDLAPVVDVERGGGIPSAASVQAWLDPVEQATGRKPIIYVSPSFANDHLGSGFGAYPLWVADWNVAQPQLPHGWSTWTFWQYADKGAVAGIEVDHDYHNGPFGDALAPAGSTTAPVTPPAPTPAPTPSPSGSSGRTYRVMAGDTLSGIAARFGTTVAAIATLNGIADPNLIHVGQELKIP